MSGRDKLCWVMLLGLAVFILAAMMAIGQPVPPKPKPVLHSPKGLEAVKSLAKVSSPKPLAIVLPPALTTNLLTWDNTYRGSNVAFSVEWRTELANPWAVISLQTNLYTYQHVTTNAHGYYRVGAFWP